jgi:hypothetical protein
VGTELNPRFAGFGLLAVAHPSITSCSVNEGFEGT